MTENKRENVMEKIKKLFALAENNPSEEEAKVAILKAQELMVQYDIETTDLDDLDIAKAEEIEEEWVDLPPKKWKYTLAQIVAKHFKVRHFYCGKQHLIFYGHKTDAKIASETFKFLFNIGNKLGMRLYNEAKRAYRDTTNIYNSAVMGFCLGIEEALAEQSKALMVLTPEDVNEAFEERTRHARSSNLRPPRAYRGSAFEEGRRQGYNAMKRNALEGGN